jgi:hypothetical protein
MGNLVSSAAIARPLAPRGTTGPFYSTGFEPGEGFVPGSLSGQMGWQTSPFPATNPSVANANPFAGTQHMRIVEDPAEPPGFPGVLGFSPRQPAGRNHMSVMFNISNTGGADYFLNPQSPGLGLSSTRVAFDSDDRDGDNLPGDILVISDPDGPGPGGPSFLVTGFQYTPGVWAQFEIESPSQGVYNYYLNGTLIAGPLFGFHNAEGVAPDGWEEVVFIDDQLQLPGETADFDNFVSVPAPGAVSLLGLGGMLAGRRRR